MAAADLIVRWPRCRRRPVLEVDVWLSIQRVSPSSWDRGRPAESSRSWSSPLLAVFELRTQKEKKIVRYDKNPFSSGLQIFFIQYFPEYFQIKRKYLLCKALDLHRIRPDNLVLRRKGTGSKCIARCRDTGSFFYMPYMH